MFLGGFAVKRVFSVLLTLAFVLSLSGCSDSEQHNKELELAREEGRNEGYEQGYERGLGDAFDIIDIENYDRSAAYDSGYDDGYIEGYQTGVRDNGEDAYDDGYVDGYDDGFITGANIEDPVYIVADDTTFHQYWCSHVGDRYSIVSKDEAISAGYTQCSNCQLQIN